MYEEKARKAKKTADVYYAKAKDGEGEHYFGLAKKYYKIASEFEERAKTASSESWKSRKTS